MIPATDDGTDINYFLPSIATLGILIGQVCQSIIADEMADELDWATWSTEEQVQLVTYLMNKKLLGCMADGGTFPTTTWHNVSTHIKAQLGQLDGLGKHPGGVKTAKWCKEKWGQVSIEYILWYHVDSCFFSWRKYFGHLTITWCNQVDIGMMKEEQISLETMQKMSGMHTLGCVRDFIILFIIN